jgi:ribosomal protein S27AE
MTCPRCGHEMNPHAEKVAYAEPGDAGFDPGLGGVVETLHRCPACGTGTTSVPAETRSFS